MRLTRQKFLKTAGAGAAWIALTSALGCEPKQTRSGHSQTAQPKHAQSSQSPPAPAQYARTFRSRPDLSPPAVEVTTPAHKVAPGYVFVAPKKGPGQYGPMILDDSGRLVWFWPLESEDDSAMDFKVQRYRGQPVLTWWEGKAGEWGNGSYRIFDGSYRRIKTVRAGNGYAGDGHEFLITPQDTALLTIYGPVSMDLSSLGGPKDGSVMEGIIQEVDIATGEVLFEWHSLEHVNFEESYAKLPENPEWDYDYFHINAIHIDHDGNLLVTARKTSAVYKIDRKSGEILWRLGGKKSDFEMVEGTKTLYHHDARRQPDGTITLFDNGNEYEVEQSRGLVMEVDEDAMTATLVREYIHPDKVLAPTQGNMQVLENGNVFVGWGSEPVFSEFNSDGELLFSASLPAEPAPNVESYRAFRFPWSGQPQKKPDMVAEPGVEEEITVYASWNGATEIDEWQVLAGPSRGQLRPIGSASRDGFETAITVHTTERFIGVVAKDRLGRAVGTAKTVEP